MGVVGGGILGMPLDADHPAAVELDRFDRAIGCGAGDAQSASEHLDRLMVDRVTAGGGGGHRERDIGGAVQRDVVIREAVSDRGGAIRNVLEQRAATRNIEQLHTPANREYREVAI